MLRLASLLDRRGQYDLADRIESTTRLAQTRFDDDTNSGWIDPAGKYDAIGTMEHWLWLEDQARRNQEIERLRGVSDDLVNDAVRSGWTRHMSSSYQISRDHWQQQLRNIERNILDKMVYRFPNTDPDTQITIEVTGDLDRDRFLNQYEETSFRLGDLIESGDIMSVVGKRVAMLVAKMARMTSSAATRFVRVAQAIQPMFNKLDPSELSKLYQLELRYSELAQRSGPGEEGGDDWPSRARRALAMEVDRIGNQLYDLCRCVNICSEFSEGGNAFCPDCMGPNAGDYADEDDIDDYDHPSMEPIEDDNYACEYCGRTMHLYDLDEAFPTGGTWHGKEHIAHFMSTWRSLRQDPNALQQKIIAIHYIINAVHGSGAMAPMFFSGKTGDIRTKLDQLSGKFETASISRFVRLARRLPSGTEVNDVYDAVGRTGLPPHLRQMMGLSKDNPRMRTPLYRVPGKPFDQTMKTPGMSGCQIGDPLPDWAVSGLGLEGEHLPEQFILNRSPGNPFSDVHEATHVRGGDLQDDGLKQDVDSLRTVKGMVNYALDPGEIEARIQEMVAFLYAKKNATFPQFMSNKTRAMFDRKTFWHPSNAVQSIIWDEVKAAGTIEDALRNRDEIIERTRQRFIDGPLGIILAGFAKKMGAFGALKIADFLRGNPWDISPEQTAHLTNQLEHRLNENWLPKGVREELNQFENTPRRASVRSRFTRLAQNDTPWTGVRQCLGTPNHPCFNVYHEDIEEWLPHKHKIEDASHGLCPDCIIRILEQANHKKIASSHLDIRDQFDNIPRRASVGSRFTRLAAEPHDQEIGPAFQKLEPVELNTMYRLEQPYAELRRKKLNEGSGSLTDTQYMDMLAGTGNIAGPLERHLDQLGDQLYGLCRSTESRIGVDYHGYGLCPRCWGGDEGRHTMRYDYIDGESDPKEDVLECENCGLKMDRDHWETFFPTGKTDFGQNYINNYMQMWPEARARWGNDSIPGKIIAIQYIINAIHGEGDMAPMFFEGDTTDIRRQLDQLSGKLDNITRKAATDSRFTRLAMRPFNPETDVRDPEAYQRLLEMTDDPNPIRHIQPAYRGSVPLIVTPHTQVRGVGNARGWAKTVGPEHRDYLSQSDELSDLIYRATRGVEPGQLMSSQRTGGGTPVHEQAHIDFGNKFLSHHDTKKKLGVEDSDNWLYWSLAPGEIAAQIQQIAAAVRNVGFHTKTDKLGVTDDIINKPKDPHPTQANPTPHLWSGNDFKYIRLKSGVQDDDIFGAVMNVVARIGWGPILKAAEIVARGPREYHKNMNAYRDIREARERQQKEYERAVKMMEAIIASVQTAKARRGLPDEVTPEELPDITPENERWRMQEISNRMIRKREEDQARLQQANEEADDVQQEFREQISALNFDDPKAIPPLAISQATARETDRILGEYTDEMNQMLSAGGLTQQAQQRAELNRIDKIYGLNHFASQMAFALDTDRVENIIEMMIERGGLRQLPGENLEHELPPEVVERARRYATARERNEVDNIVEVIQPRRYENALVASKFNIPLSVVQNLLFAEGRAENVGMENAIGELQGEILDYAPSEDLIISILPFLVGEKGRSQRQHWLTNNPELITKWRQELPDQPVIEGSKINHDRVREEWDRRMSQHTE